MQNELHYYNILVHLIMNAHLMHHVLIYGVFIMFFFLNKLMCVSVEIFVVIFIKMYLLLNSLSIAIYHFTCWQLMKFDQTEFGAVENVSMDSTGYIYVLSNCQGKQKQISFIIFCSFCSLFLIEYLYQTLMPDMQATMKWQL